ncbi:MAG: S8 family peptidase [Saprospiraceae bacterium]|nr:S8 family peptidase [Candidatus Brachybacter algidus]
MTKLEKGRLAFNQLNDHMNSLSTSVTNVLKQNNIKYRVNISSSSISVNNVDIATLNILASDPFVKGILYNYAFNNLKELPLSDQLEVRNTYTWGVAKVEADKLHELGYTGVGAVLGGNDTGFDWTHPAIRAKYRGWNGGIADHNYNWHDAIHENSPLSNPNTQNPCGLNIKFPCDDNSHGTHTMGTMVGVQGDTLTIGMAPGAKWIATRDMECNVDNWILMQITVSNLKAAGVVVVASAGNSGPNCETIAFVPGMLDEAFSIGATDFQDTIAGFSSRGAVSADGSFRLKPDVSAPGVNVLSSVPNNGYNYYSGTSMAGPHVAGLVALMVGANPLLAGQVDTIQEIIKRTAEPIPSGQSCSGFDGGTIPNAVYGYGRINALKAVNEALKFTLSRNSLNNDLSFSLYPNPAFNDITISLKGNDEIQSVVMVDITGRVLLNKQLEGKEYMTRLNLDGFPSGSYFVKVVTKNQSGIAKLIITN